MFVKEVCIEYIKLSFMQIVLNLVHTNCPCFSCQMGHQIPFYGQNSRCNSVYVDGGSVDHHYFFIFFHNLMILWKTFQFLHEQNHLCSTCIENNTAISGNNTVKHFVSLYFLPFFVQLSSAFFLFYFAVIILLKYLNSVYC